MPEEEFEIVKHQFINDDDIDELFNIDYIFANKGVLFVWLYGVMGSVLNLVKATTDKIY